MSPTPESPLVLQYLANLELKFPASDEEIKKAYRRLMKEYHPDLYENGSEKYQLALQISQKLTEAYQYLLK